MADEPDNLTLRLLRELRDSIEALRGTTSELVVRMGRVESGLAHVRVEMAEVHTVLAEHSVKLDRFGDRLDRIDKRFGLIEA